MGTERIRPPTVRPISAEMDRLLGLVIAQQEAEKRMLAAMTPEDRDAYITQWAAQLARGLAQHTD